MISRRRRSRLTHVGPDNAAISGQKQELKIDSWTGLIHTLWSTIFLGSYFVLKLYWVFLIHDFSICFSVSIYVWVMEKCGRRDAYSSTLCN